MAARALFNSFLKTGRDIVFKWWLSVRKTTGPRETKISDRHLSKREDENTDFFFRESSPYGFLSKFRLVKK